MEIVKPGWWRLGCVFAAATAAVLLVATGCGPRAAAGERSPVAADFRAAALTVLERHCADCHGTTDVRLAAESAASGGKASFRWLVEPSGHTPPAAIEDLERACIQRLDAESPLLASPLLRACLPEALSGLQHPAIFAGVEDPDFRALAEWAAAARPASTGEFAATSEAEQFFAARMIPLLTRKTCFGANCHGSLAFNDLRLDAGMPALGTERFTPRMHHENRRQMLGQVTRLVNMTGDPGRSRQLLKSIPVEQGGVVHKGGNNFLRVGDPDHATFARWLELEAAEAKARSRLAADAPRGWVFVRRPRVTPERFFEDLEFLPGGDLWLRDADGEHNLTAALHPAGPADIRAPDVSYDGSRVAFAMRRSAAEFFQIWELEFATGAARQLTFSAAPGFHCMDPLWVPDATDADGQDLARANLVFVSDEAGESCVSSPEAILGQAIGGDEFTLHDPARTERAGAFDGRRIRILSGAGEGAERRVKHSEPGRLALDRPLDAAADATTHYAIEAVARHAPKFDAWLLPAAAPGAESAAWTARARMTWSPSQVRRPAMRSSGEVMFTCLRTGWQGGKPFYNGAIFRVHADGSNFHTHNGNRSSIPILADNRETVEGLEVRIGRDADSWWGGALLLSDHQFGPTIEAHNPADDLTLPYREGLPASSLPRFVPGWISLDPAVATGGLSTGGAYRDPYPLDDGSLLVSWAPGPIDLHDPAAAPDFDVLRLIPDPSFQSPDGARAGSFRREVLVASPAAELWARPVAPRLKEPVKKKLKLETDLLGVPQRISGLPRYSAGTPALVEIYDLPLLAAFFEQVTPLGPRHVLAGICPACGLLHGEEERIVGVRLVGALPQRPGETGALRRVVLAEGPLAEDGSAYLALPSGIAFDVQALNALGMAVAMPNRWLYCLPGERHTLSIPRALYPQTCGGCHGGLSGDRRDVLAAVDGVTAASRTLAVWDAEAGHKRRPTNWSDGWVPPAAPADFEQDVRPILERGCVGCHAEFGGPGARAALLPFVEHRAAMAIESYLMEKLLGRELRAPRALTGDAPHPSAAPLGADELRVLARWMDLGAMAGGSER